MAVQPLRMTPQMPVVRLELQKAAVPTASTDECRAARVHDEDHGAETVFCASLVGAGARAGKAEAVVVAHDALDDGDITAAGVLREQDSEAYCSSKKKGSRFELFAPMMRLWNMGSM